MSNKFLIDVIDSKTPYSGQYDEPPLQTITTDGIDPPTPDLHEININILNTDTPEECARKVKQAIDSSIIGD